MRIHLAFLAAALTTVSAGSVPLVASAQAAAAMPTCAAGDPVVWENSRSKVYHSQGDSYFGKTKSGSYACQSAAVAAGYHAVGGKSSMNSTGASSMASPGAMATSSGMMPGRHHPHHRMSSPAPSMESPVPVAPSAPVPMASPNS